MSLYYFHKPVTGHNKSYLRGRKQHVEGQWWQKGRLQRREDNRKDLQCVHVHGFSYSYQIPFLFILRLLVVLHSDNLYSSSFPLMLQWRPGHNFCYSCRPRQLVKIYCDLMQLQAAVANNLQHLKTALLKCCILHKLFKVARVFWKWKEC